ncbi:MAG: hypothetical protein V7K12_19965 [Nostoc sp.]
MAWSLSFVEVQPLVEKYWALVLSVAVGAAQGREILGIGYYLQKTNDK